MVSRRWIRAAVVAASALVAACAPPSEPLVPLPGGPTTVVPAAPDSTGPLRLEGGAMVDARGRQVLLHGTNMVIKAEPWLPDETILGRADLDYLRAHGVNAVRLGVWYDQVVPRVGEVDTAYLDRLERVVDRLTEAGLWVLFDFHQDVFWGMPEWATTPTAAALSDEHPAFLDVIGWAAAYTSPRSIQQWRDVILDAPTATDPSRTIWDALGDGAAAVAERFADEPRVVGIELLNEPFPGEWYLECILVGCGWLENLLADHYDGVTARIRAVAPDMVVWWETFVSAPHYGPTFMRAPADPQVGFAWHAYCSGTDGGSAEAAPELEVLRCRGLLGTAWERAMALADSWGRPALMTEFGASRNPLDATIATREADRHLSSWFHWHHRFLGDDGTPPALPSNVESQLTRIYPEATAGTPRELTFDPATGAARYRFTPDPSATGPTSIVVPAAQYPAGYDVVVQGGSVTSAADSARLEVVAGPGSGDVVVTITRR